ncbi:MAG: hypothetical protein RLZZ631_526 [Cyanobacteriota bacterium]
MELDLLLPGITESLKAPLKRDSGAMETVLAAVLIGSVSVAGLAAPAADVTCRVLKEQRDLLARQAFEAEIAVLHRLRLQICPRQETADQSELDYGAYVRCRHQAEAQLERSRPVLYRNSLGFTYYTPAGARLARQADALIQQQACP